jgi:hypothetical protein
MREKSMNTILLIGCTDKELYNFYYKKLQNYISSEEIDEGIEIVSDNSEYIDILCKSNKFINTVFKIDLLSRENTEYGIQKMCEYTQRNNGRVIAFYDWNKWYVNYLIGVSERLGLSTTVIFSIREKENIKIDIQDNYLE